MLKKILSVILSLILITTAFAGCSNTTDKALDGTVKNLSDAYKEYLKNNDPLPQSVLDNLNLMLDNYVSGTAAPSIDNIDSTPVNPSDDEAQDIIDDVSDGVVSSEKELVDVIHKAVANLEETVSVEISGNWCNPDTVYDVVFRQVNDFYMIDVIGLKAYSYMYTTLPNSNSAYKFTLYYFDDFTIPQIKDMRAKVEQKAKDVVKQLGLIGMSDYDKIFAINKYLCDTVKYPNEPYITLDFTPYGALIDGRAVCDGYARATKILCDFSNTDCYYQCGFCGNNPDTDGHAWNLVKVDGQYYQLDVTWNDASKSDDYFLVTDDFMSLSRTWNRNNYPPSAKKPYKKK